MKKVLLTVLLSTATLPSFALDEFHPNIQQTQDSNQSEVSPALQDIKKYLHNLGIYWGYYLENTQEAPAKNTLITETEGSTDDLNLIAQYAFFAVFGANPVNTFFADFLPTDSSSVYSSLNAWANATFMSYETPSHSPVSVTSLIDQQTYQKDPVNQAVLNIVGTPDYTFCLDYSGTNWNANCQFLYQNKVMRNVTGPLPVADTLFSYDYQKQFLSQLNANVLIAPLIYSVTGNNSNSTSSTSTSTSTSDNGLTAKNQVDNAANFIRYATGAVQPITSISRQEYDKQWTTANPSSTANETSAQRTARENAQATLTSYLNSVRIYAAKSSVAIGNLYYILSKRLPQTNLNGSSQALNELTMATRRLYNPDKEATQWLDSINTASPVTVQREMALLLSEINYQLYLNRQQEERLLLTNSLLLLQNLSQNKPALEVVTATSTKTEQ